VGEHQCGGADAQQRQAEVAKKFAVHGSKLREGQDFE
jgi:hypothetical protein